MESFRSRDNRSSSSTAADFLKVKSHYRLMPQYNYLVSSLLLLQPLSHRQSIFSYIRSLVLFLQSHYQPASQLSVLMSQSVCVT